jgi:sterol desaturase/sphingolipid hydroxylase (fatty acid hydroxylase superfamily)
MDFLKILEAVNMVLVIIGVVLITTPKIEGLYVFIFAQAGWCILAWNKGMYWFFAQSLFLFVFNFIGIYNWRRKNVG